MTKLSTIAAELKGQSFHGLFELASTLRDHLDPEIVATFSREMFQELGKLAALSHVPVMNIRCVKGEDNALSVRVHTSPPKSFERLHADFFFVQENDKYQLRSHLRQLSLV